METLDQDFRSTKVMSVKDWVITVIIQSIPLVGFIMLFVWAFSANEHPSRQNYAKAVLLVMAVIIALSMVIALLFGGIIYAFFS